MKRFAFKLERILELRSFVERQTEMALAEKAAVCTRLELSLQANAKASFEASRRRFRPGSVAADHRAEELYSQRLGKERDRIQKAMALAEAERDTARKAYIKASMDRKIVDKLKDKKAADYYKNLYREESKVMDDFASSANTRNSMADRG